MSVNRRDETVRSGDVELAGSWWEPAAPIATVLMHPGSGPSDRDDDTYFPPIRDHLVAAGIAVVSFDKRGVGGSSGDWRDAGIAEQADDVAAVVSHLAAHGATSPIGLFGHSQGGWVVLEAARRTTPAAFVITSSGPGVPRPSRTASRSTAPPTVPDVMPPPRNCCSAATTRSPSCFVTAPRSMTRSTAWTRSA